MLRSLEEGFFDLLDSDTVFGGGLELRYCKVMTLNINNLSPCDGDDGGNISGSDGGRSSESIPMVDAAVEKPHQLNDNDVKLPNKL